MEIINLQELRALIFDLAEMGRPREYLMELVETFYPDFDPPLKQTEIEQLLTEARQHELRNKPFLSATELQELQLPPLKPVIDPILPEGLTVFAGKPKTGKSWFVLGNAIDVAHGHPAFGLMPVQKGDVLYLALEDGKRRLQERIGVILGDQPWPKNLIFQWDCPKLDANGVREIEERIESRPNVVLLVIDTFIRVRPRPGRRSYSIYQDDYDALKVLQELAKNLRIAIIVIFHTRKEEAEDPLDMVSGTAGLTGAADTVWVLTRKERGKMEAILVTTGRDIEERNLALTFEIESGRWKIIGKPEDFTRGEERQKIIDTLKKAGSPLGPKEIHDAIPGSRHDAIRKLIRTMLDQGDLAQPERGKYTLPGHIHHSDHSSNSPPSGHSSRHISLNPRDFTEDE
jgi:hypothetical protein